MSQFKWQLLKLSKKQCIYCLGIKDGILETEDPKAEVDALLAAYKRKMKQLMDQKYIIEIIKLKDKTAVKLVWSDTHGCDYSTFSMTIWKSSN
jgi:hypothetical protein